MAHHHVSIFSTLTLVITMLWAGAMAQSDDCTNVLVSMSPCVEFISGNSSSAPSVACCTQLGSVAKSQPQCLCQVINGGGSNLGLNVNQTQALALPRACNVQTPPASQCRAASPSGSPGSRTEGSPGNDGSSIKLNISMLFLMVFSASYVSVFSI